MLWLIIYKWLVSLFSGAAFYSPGQKALDEYLGGWPRIVRETGRGCPMGEFGTADLAKHFGIPYEEAEAVVTKRHRDALLEYQRNNPRDTTLPRA